MSQYDTPSTLSGLFKEIYGDDVLNLVPESAKLIKLVPFVPRDKEIGNKYHQPVILAHEQGFTYAAYNAGAFALNNSVALTMQDAQVSSSQVLLRTAISYDAAARASSSKKAFVKATELIVENMVESMSKRVEIANIYGGSAYGIGAADTSSNVDTATTDIVLTTASWASGIWAGAEGSTLDLYYAGSVVNSTGAITVSRVDILNKTIRVTAATGDITAIDAAILAHKGLCYFYFYGAYGNEMSGLDAILTNTGTLFNISAATYGLWKGNTYSASSATLTMGKLLSAVALPVQRGLNEEATVLVNPNTWANIMSDLAAQRRFDGSYDKSKLTNGSEAVEFYSQNGALKIYSHNIIKEGEAFVFPHKKCMRIGAQEMSFKTPGREEEIFLQLPSNAGYELRNYTDQAFFLETPARAVKITTIVNS